MQVNRFARRALISSLLLPLPPVSSLIARHGPGGEKHVMLSPVVIFTTREGRCVALAARTKYRSRRF